MNSHDRMPWGAATLAGSCDTGFHTFGDWPVEEVGEPIVAVNPIHPNNIVTAWIQGPFQDIIAAVSFDGGQTWQSVPIPLTTCSGGPFGGAGDPWLSFAPNGDLYAVAETGSSFSTLGIYVSKSDDGGLHWSAPLLVPGSFSKDPGPSRGSQVRLYFRARLTAVSLGSQLVPSSRQRRKASFSSAKYSCCPTALSWTFTISVNGSSTNSSLTCKCGVPRITAEPGRPQGMRSQGRRFSEQVLG